MLNLTEISDLLQGDLISFTNYITNNGNVTESIKEALLNNRERFNKLDNATRTHFILQNEDFVLGIPSDFFLVDAIMALSNYSLTIPHKSHLIPKIVAFIDKALDRMDFKAHGIYVLIRLSKINTEFFDLWRENKWTSFPKLLEIWPCSPEEEEAMRDAESKRYRNSISLEKLKTFPALTVTYLHRINPEKIEALLKAEALPVNTGYFLNQDPDATDAEVIEAAAFIKRFLINEKTGNVSALEKYLINFTRPLHLTEIARSRFLLNKIDMEFILEKSLVQMLVDMTQRRVGGAFFADLSETKIPVVHPGWRRSWSTVLDMFIFLGIAEFLTSDSIQPGAAKKRDNYWTKKKLRSDQTDNLWQTILNMDNVLMLSPETALSIMQEIPHANKTELRSKLLHCALNSTLVLVL